ncbi:uncharacterized protein EI90DRAFT_3124062 [Cantharellus anzutake]|uniref:uncharacterized protein n=1 Tax=Cantharellus anzutake TaxID=1750568 RepID=UPI001904F517|nr:uncharacterized protein EI90DRAFT_3124062 [Cantharellus anzutake]KAF8330858.1 hypothetical protein EI90DRAFT_3124062 [Cantharellus anzutake]
MSQTTVKPAVAFVGSTGLLGKSMVPIFAQAANSGELSELRLLVSSTPKLWLERLISDTVKIVQVNYADQKALENALQGVDVVVSALGTNGTEVARRNLINAAVAAKIKAYVPSEYGSDMDVNPYPLPMFEEKQAHLREAKAAGLKTISLLTGFFLETIFSPPFGFISATNTWNLPDSGSNRFAVTSMADIGRYTLRAVILVFEEPEKALEKLRILGDNSTLDEYAAAFESISGEPPTKNTISRDQLKANFDADGTIVELVKLLVADGLADFTENDNELLNPGQKYFKPKTVAEYAKEVGGKPWITIHSPEIDAS